MLLGSIKICRKKITRLKLFSFAIILILMLSSFTLLNEMAVAQRETNSLEEEKMLIMQEFKKSPTNFPKEPPKNFPRPPKKNLVFIKCMKCATETMANIFRTYGYIRNLSFVLPVKNNIYLGWPFLMNESHYRPSSKGFNFLVEHSIFNDTIMDKIMPPDTVYVSIIREPYKHFMSTFHYFNIKTIAKVKGDDPLTEYLEHIEDYDRYYKTPEASRLRYCIPNGFSISKNLMSHCLGMPLGYPVDRKDISNNKDAILAYIDQLDKKFSLIMLVEYFHESLILLKRLMSWSFKDIIYYRVNSANYTYSPKTERKMKIHQNWSSVDYILYDHFNKTFWKKVELENDFFEEVQLYGSAQKQVKAFCKIDKPGSITISASKFDSGFFFSHDDCVLQKKPISTLLKQRYDSEHRSGHLKTYSWQSWVSKKRT